MVVSIPAEIKQCAPLAVPRCDECGSTNFMQNLDGYTVCGTCGLVCDETPFVISDPISRNGGILEAHAVTARNRGTFVGSRAEHQQANRALQRATRVSGPSYYIHVLEMGYFAIKRIMCLASLEGQGALLDGANRLFKRFYDALPPGSQARNGDVLAIVAVYRAASQAGFPINFRQDLVPCLPGPHLLPAAFEALKRSAPLCVPVEGIKQLLGCVQRLAGDLNLSGTMASTAGRFTLKNYRFFPASKASISAAAILEAACLCAGEDIPVTHVASAAGVATSAVLRCLRGAISKRGRIAAGSIRWVDLKAPLVNVFRPEARDLPVPAIVRKAKMPAGASVVAGFITGEVEASLLASEIHYAPLQAAIVIAGKAGHARPSTPKQLAKIVRHVAASTGVAVEPVVHCLLQVRSISRVLPSYLSEDILSGIMPTAPALPISSGADGPPGQFSLALGNPGDPPTFR